MVWRKLFFKLFDSKFKRILFKVLSQSPVQVGNHRMLRIVLSPGTVCLRPGSLVCQRLTLQFGLSRKTTSSQVLFSTLSMDIRRQTRLIVNKFETTRMSEAPEEILELDPSN